MTIIVKFFHFSFTENYEKFEQFFLRIEYKFRETHARIHSYFYETYSLISAHSLHR